MTYRHHADRVASSANGRYRLEAASPQNRPAHPHHGRGHEREFGYRLVDVTHGRALWERAQDDGEGSPVELFVSDEGLAVVRAHWLSWTDDSLLALDRAGRKRLVVIVTSAEASGGGEPDASARRVVWRDPHVLVSTAGPVWTLTSLPYFTHVDGAPFFCWRPWWGRRIVIDLEEMLLLEDGAVVPRALGIRRPRRDDAHHMERTGGPFTRRVRRASRRRGGREPRALLGFRRATRPRDRLLTGAETLAADRPSM